MAGISETETVIKRIVPYLTRRGYDLQNDLTFEDLAITEAGGRKGFVDILVSCGKATPPYLIEAKRDGTKLIAKHRKQALDYGKAKHCLFVALTDGKTFELLNTKTGHLLKINNSAANRLPSKSDLEKYVIPQLKKNPSVESIEIETDRSLPYRPGLSLSKLNQLIKGCHNVIRKIEKNEEHAFADFSKLMFLKLLEEKWDADGSVPPYSFQFHELASEPKTRADRVTTAVKEMISKVREKNPQYGDVLADPIHLKKDATYLSLVKTLSSVSFSDCELDTKGAAFEYFVRATLKGKKLGQYFTPRPLVRLMLHLGRYQQILQSLKINQPFKVLDPACGTGGFLVYGMNLCLSDVDKELREKKIHSTVSSSLTKSLKEETFFGIDAHDGVASSAKMNMIIAGDGHNNIRCLDSLAPGALIPSYSHEGKTVTDGKAHLILSNPPFGTSEGESLSESDLGEYSVRSTRGQALFIQKMIESAHDESLIVTVIDDGLLNTGSLKDLRRHVLEQCRLEMIISLPDETFKPNKINVKSSVLVLKRRSNPDVDLLDQYPVPFITIQSLGYDGSGEELKEFQIDKLIQEVSSVTASALPKTSIHAGYSWCGFQVSSNSISKDSTFRFDYRYWNPEVKARIDALSLAAGSTTINKINQIPTKRGKSPSASDYVSQVDGYALVVKAGSNISKKGILITKGDYIEEPLFIDAQNKGYALEDGDILLASTGDGTLGKCAVYRNNDAKGLALPAIPDGHVTAIRVDKKKIHPEFLCDFLRVGFGKLQVDQLFTGSTGLIEITPVDVGRIVVPKFPSLAKQKSISDTLRKAEDDAEAALKKVQHDLEYAETTFLKLTQPAIK